MIVYEVNLFVARAIEEQFRPWLSAHVREMVALPGFLGAQLFERAEPVSDEGELVLCTQYRLVDRAALDAYLRDHAAGMRADGLARFGSAFRAERRILEALGDA